MSSTPNHPKSERLPGRGKAVAATEIITTFGRKLDTGPPGTGLDSNTILSASRDGSKDGTQYQQYTSSEGRMSSVVLQPCHVMCNAMRRIDFHKGLRGLWSPRLS